jgi:hypothetical protein
MISGAVLMWDTAARSLQSEPGLPDPTHVVFTMWPLIDTALHLLDEANLISARRGGIELDLESLWRTVVAATEAAPAPGASRERLRALDDRLLDVLTHAWPVPRDPVVIALRYQADHMRDALHAMARGRLRAFSAVQAPGGPAGILPYREQ